MEVLEPLAIASRFSSVLLPAHVRGLAPCLVHDVGDGRYAGLELIAGTINRLSQAHHGHEVLFATPYVSLPSLFLLFVYALWFDLLHFSWFEIFVFALIMLYADRFTLLALVPEFACYYCTFAPACACARLNPTHLIMRLFLCSSSQLWTTRTKQ